MRLTRSVGYAIGVLLRVVAEDTTAPVPAKTIAEDCDVPPRFIYRILRRLVDAGLLEGLSGPGGGYRLAQKPTQISLFDIVIAIDGPLPEPDLEPIHKDQAAPIAAVNALCQQSQERFASLLEKTSLAKLARM